jgi:hypothetical protein
MSTFVEVPSARLFERLEAAGFRRGVQGREVFYERSHAQDGRLSVRVYTSAAEGSETARDNGADAIRVIAQFQWLHRASNEMRRKNLFQAKILRVTSVEGVLDRMIDAARKAYAACNEFRKQSNARADHRSASVVAGERPAPAPSFEREMAQRGVTDDDAYEIHRDRTR